MQLTRLVLLGVGGGALVVWVASAATSTNVSVVQPMPVDRRVTDTRGAALQAEIAKLHDRLRPDAAPLQRRDLFRYGAPQSRQTRPLETAAPAAIAVPAVVSPPFKLIGLAEDLGAEGPVRTAIISGAGQLFMVKEGEAVTSRYRVVKISLDVVELFDEQQQQPLRLGLR